MAIAVLIVFLVFSPLLFVVEIGNIFNLPPVITGLLAGPYLEFLITMFGNK